MSKQGIYRQGDLLLIKITCVPEGAQQKDNILLAGEVTGHHHKLDGDGEVLIKDGNQFVVARQKTVVVHEEHEKIVLPEGIYAIHRQREFSPLADRQVMD